MCAIIFSLMISTYKEGIQGCASSKVIFITLFVMCKATVYNDARHLPYYAINIIRNTHKTLEHEIITQHYVAGTTTKQVI